MSDAETTRRVLLRAAEILEPEGAWCQQYYAKDAHGNDCMGWDHQAVCWCGVGAIEKAHDELRGQADVMEAAILAVGRVVGLSSWASDWNDAPERTQAEVVQALKQAAASLPS